MKRYSYEEVKTFIEQNSKCILLSKEYKNTEQKLALLCDCGNEFEASFEKILRRNKRCCNACSRKRLSELKKPSISEVKKYVEENSDCTLLSTEYIDAHSKLLLRCGCGDEFLVPYKHFKNGSQRQCQRCGRNIQASKRCLDYGYVKEFIEVTSQSGCKLLSTSYINSRNKIRIQCSCGTEYTTLFHSFRRHDVRSCLACRQEQPRSKGEIKIAQWLTANNIKFEGEYVFSDLRNTNSLRFDFAILNDDDSVKMLIEFDGKQHFGLGAFSSDEEEMLLNYQNTMYNDLLKNEFCFDNCIPLLRIPYNKYPKIEEILSKALL